MVTSSEPVIYGFIYLVFRERGREGETEGEKHQCINVWLPLMFSPRPPVDLAHNLGVCPDWESNLEPFDLQAGAQSTEPHHPGRNQLAFKYLCSSGYSKWVAQ